MHAHAISIIIPAYNVENYIVRTVDSVIAQSYKNLEIIVVNDGSTDATAQILDRLAAQDERIRVIHKENGGVTGARLRGVAEATGEWIGFVDGDDVIEPRMYERLLENALQYQADISHCGYQMVFPKGHVDYYYNTGRLAQQDRTEALAALLDGSYIEPGLWNKLFHKSLFHSLLHGGVMDGSIRNNEDLLMNYYLFREAKRSVYEDVCPYHYLLRVSSATTSGISEHKLKDPMRVARILLAQTQGEAAVHVAAKKRYLRQMIADATLDCAGQPGLMKPYRREIRRELRGALGGVLADHDFSAKMKLMALWAGTSPETYAGIHRLYAKLRGFDTIYSLDK